MVLKFLMFGDIVGKIGRRAIIKVLPELKKKYGPDLVLANVENLAHGKGITEKTLEEMVGAGIDVFTSGDHVFDKDEVVRIFEEKKYPLIRPGNFPPGVPGNGAKTLEIGTKKVLVVNLIGRVGMKSQYECPFRQIDATLKEHEDENLSAIIIDFHAETTSEKNAFGWYADGRVSAVLGTHTHIGTDDARILPEGTAYLTDIGMVGARDSVLGVDKVNILKNFLTQIAQLHEIPEEGPCIVNAVYFEVDPKTKKSVKIKKVSEEVKI